MAFLFMRLPQSLALVLARSLVLALPLTKCALRLSLRYALRVHESRTCACVLCVCMFCERVCMCVCVRACRFRWLLFELFFFLFSLICVAALPNEKGRRRTLAQTFSAFFFIIIYIFVQFKCRSHRSAHCRGYQIRRLLWNGKIA